MQSIQDDINLNHFDTNSLFLTVPLSRVPRSLEPGWDGQLVSGEDSSDEEYPSYGFEEDGPSPLRKIMGLPPRQRCGRNRAPVAVSPSPTLRPIPAKFMWGHNQQQVLRSMATPTSAEENRRAWYREAGGWNAWKRLGVEASPPAEWSAQPANVTVAPENGTGAAQSGCLPLLVYGTGFAQNGSMTVPVLVYPVEVAQNGCMSLPVLANGTGVTHNGSVFPVDRQEGTGVGLNGCVCRSVLKKGSGASQSVSGSPDDHQEGTTRADSTEDDQSEAVVVANSLEPAEANPIGDAIVIESAEVALTQEMGGNIEPEKPALPRYDFIRNLHGKKKRPRKRQR